MCSRFFVACGDATELLERIEEAFDEIASLVTMPIIVAGTLAVGSRGDDRLDLLRFKPFDPGIGVVTLVGNHRAGTGRLIEQGGRLADVGLFGTREREADGIAECVDKAVDLGAESAARTPQSLWAAFFWAPAACGWARIAVLSIMTSSKSGSALTVWNTRSQIPDWVQRAKRVKVVCQWPSSGGKSRHGAPVRPIHNTASRNNRLSLAVTPISSPCLAADL